MERTDPERKVYVAIIDDDESVCRSMSRLLRAAHFQPVAYLSAESFLEDVNHPKFACLLLDVRLQGMSGLDLRQRLSAVRDPTPVLFITAYDDPGVRAEALAAGCTGFFLKTDPGAGFLSCIRRIAGMEEMDPADGSWEGPMDLTP